MWEYKTGYFNSADSELDSKLNKFGLDGWEVFSLVEVGFTNEFSGGGIIKKYRIMMKRIKS